MHRGKAVAIAAAISGNELMNILRVKESSTKRAPRYNIARENL